MRSSRRRRREHAQVWRLVRHTRIGEIAREALPVIKAHFQREEEYVLPPLTLAPAIAEGRVTPDMRWVIDMVDRIKADRETIFEEHTKITKLMTELREAAVNTEQHDVMEFARNVVLDSELDTEVMEPASIAIGEYLRAKLPLGP